MHVTVFLCCVFLGPVPLSVSPSAEPYLPFLPMVDSEALIKVELDIIKPADKQPTIHIASILFNSLDFVGKCVFGIDELLSILDP